MNPTTPASINKDVLAFCNEISNKASPIFVKVTPIEGYRDDDCYGNVEDYIQKNGGSVQYGWIIWEIPNIFIEAEFHAVWVNNGEYIDITPKSNNVERILFLPDPERKFTGDLIDNVRKPLVNDAFTKTTVIVGKRKFEIRKKYYDGSPDIEIPESEMIELEQYEKRVLLSEMQKENSIEIKKFGRNKPCPCGSGKKFKNCCLMK
jgi:hypothetical protein